MKDKLEKYIENHKDEFNTFEPSDDLWSKISVNQEKKKVIRINTRFMWRAAAVIIIFLTGFLIQEFRYKTVIDDNKRIAKQEDIMIPELQETEAYFAHKVSVMMSEVQLYSTNDPSVVEEVQFDMNELDSIYAELKNDLKDNVANDEVVEAMIQNYRVKIRILEDLLTELKQINDENNPNESVDYEL